MSQTDPGPPRYEVRVSATARKQLARLPLRVRVAMDRDLRALGQDPRPPAAAKLTGSDRWRIRVGDYRAVYEIRDAILLVLVVKVGHRAQVYKTR